jgi:hypothetical protein
MSSPGARQRRRRKQYQTPRSRRELTIATVASVMIVVGTVLIIWLLRPGGLADRQPRSSWLVGLTIVAIASACYVILRPTSRLKMSRRVALSGSLGAIAVVAGAVGLAWPGGILRHTPSLRPLGSVPTTPITAPPVTTTGATTAPTATTAPGATSTPSTAARASTGSSGSTTLPLTSTTTKRPPASPST